MTAAVPTISIVMAAYNGAAFIRATIESVFAQTMQDFEIVVADDCSKDDTLAVLATIDDPRLHVVKAERNGGPAIARNLATAQARGRFIAGLDQDDLCHPERFAKQLAYLDAHPDVVLVCSTIAMFEGEKERADPYPDLTDPDAIDWMMGLLNPLAWSTSMMRGEAARALDPFERDEYRFAEDFDLYTRIRAHGRIGRIAEPLVRYRLHPGGASRAYEEGMIRAAGRVLADRHAALLGDEATEAGLLLSRHAGASYPPPDAATLARCGAIIARLLEADGNSRFARTSSRDLWWRIARSGLRVGHYGVTDIARVRPAFAGRGTGLGPALLRDAAIGAARRAKRQALSL
ncbi:glycosyltransferase [Sphingomonas sp. CGMCC 1.13654]|uniref:Glycosyltransferase n=1 Tax=Sphingomonas chungangi TaxID=2683589 RepID=A0A838L9D4_9SPHN|nr:glycosyltransferase [Sphingomonas chungangi]MBA2935402.1 glycosyltransferase [Sphingomonas chungangi]MVW56908.1 glycosyltransferase [Sphingomonas chungangi]